MNSKLWPNKFRINLLTIGGLAMLMPQVYAAEYWLRAGATDITLPNTSAPVRMWGYASCTANFATCDPISVPGPTLSVPASDSSLNIHLRNHGLPEPVSIVIPGQIAAMPPVKAADALGRLRVYSFTTETATGADQIYSWIDLKPGTYLYHSGTHPQLQVQMGLYGGIKHDAVAATASTPAQVYPGVAYDAEVLLLYSEIDPQLHAAIATGNYGPGKPVTSTIDYAPKYFLVNGKPYQASDPALPAGAAGQRTLIRFLNAGLQSHVPVLQGLDMQLVAEDGNPYPYAKIQYSAFLPAAKTLDAIITAEPGQDGTYPIYDRRLSLSNGAQPGGGMLAYLKVDEAAGGMPIATNDSYAVDEDTALNIPPPGVLGNDTPSPGLSAVLVSASNNGSVTLAADGSFNYVPQANFSGSDSFSYRSHIGGSSSNVATVAITVQPINDPPIAANNSYSMPQGGTLNVPAPGVLGNDSDPEGDLLTAVNFGPASNGTVSGAADGGFSYAPTTNFTGTATFNYQAQDSNGAIGNVATVSITVNPNQAPVAVNDTASTPKNVAVTIDLVANDSDPDGTINPATVTIVTQPNKGGTVTVNASGTAHYTPKRNFKGSETFTYRVRDNLNKLSNTATVRVNVTR